MSQGSIILPTTGTLSGLTMVTDVNTGLAALQSSNSGASAPANGPSGAAIAGQWWLNTSASPYTIEMYDGTQWDVIGTINPTTGAFTMTAPLLTWGGAITPTSLAASVNDYAPTGNATASVYRQASTAAYNITGLLAAADGVLKIIHNIGTFDITLVNASGSSAAANRFAFDQDFVLGAGLSVVLRYDNTSTAWRLVAGDRRIATAGEATAMTSNAVLLTPARLAGLVGQGIASASGLKIVNDVTTPNTKLDVTANFVAMANASNTITARANVSVVINAGVTGANGLDTGALAASTWYYVWLIDNGTTTAGLLSLSATAPTMPGGYTYGMRVGAMATDASSIFYRFTQRGNKLQFKVTPSTNTAALPVQASGSTSSAWVAEAAVWVPPTATEIKLSTNVQNTAIVVGISPNSNYSASSSFVWGAAAPPLASAVGGTGYSFNLNIELILESTNFYYYASGAGATVLCVGWTDAVNAS